MNLQPKINDGADYRIIALFKDYSEAKNYQERISKELQANIFGIFKGKDYSWIYADLEDLLKIGMAEKNIYFNKKQKIPKIIIICVFSKVTEKHFLL